MSALTITRAKLRELDACAEGYSAFCERYDEAAAVDYAALQTALRADGRYAWSSWLRQLAWHAAVSAPKGISALVEAEVAIATAATAGSPNSASGFGSTAASAGVGSTAATAGDDSTAASSGDDSTAAAAGERTIAMVAGLRGRAKAGAHGCIALCWHDGTRTRVVVGYVGEDGIEPDVLYRVDAAGKLVRA